MKKTSEIKNYLILLAITIITVFGILYCEGMYNSKKEYEMKNTPLKGIIVEVNSEDLEPYILENPNVIIYFTSLSNPQIKNFEKNLKKKIIKDSLNKDIVYLDTDKIVNEKFYSNFSDKYFSKNLKDKKIILKKFPNMVSIKEGMVIEILYSNKKEINYEEAKQFIEIYQLMNEND